MELSFQRCKFIYSPIIFADMALIKLPNESELLQEIATGCSISFTKLFNAYFLQLSGFVQGLTQCTELTEEIVQEIFTRVWMNREMLVSVQKFDAYLFILTRNYTLSAIRNQTRKRRRLLDINYFSEDSIQPEVYAEREPDYELLIEKAVDELPPRQQEVFTLRKKGLKNPEIAMKLHISVASVIKYQQLALKFVSDFVKLKK